MRPETLPRSLFSLLAVASVAVSPAAAQKHPNQEPGFAPEKLYDFGGVDNVNLFNGNLVLRIPIGHPYATNGGLGYGLVLYGNSSVWDFKELPEFPAPGEPPDWFTLAEPGRFWNAGIGWRLSLGMLYDPLAPENDTSAAGNGGKWMYVAEDGSQHLFYNTLHEAPCTVLPPSQCESNAGEELKWDYARDGSYLRLHHVDDTGTIKELELPDGTIKQFLRASNSALSPFRLNHIRDRFGNILWVTNVLNPTTGAVDEWRISDGSRMNKVLFETSPSSGGRRVKAVVVREFNFQSATYNFVYQQVTMTRSCKHTADDMVTSPIPQTVNVDLLSEVQLPDGSSWVMPAYNQACTGGVEDLPGTLARLRLPSRGYLEWTYQTYSFFATGVGVPPGLHQETNAGVATKKLLNENQACSDHGGNCTWSYTTGRVSSFPNPYVRQTTVVSPRGDATVNYFTDNPKRNQSTWTGWEYGLAYNPLQGDGAGKYLSQEFYEGSVAGGNKKRSIYQRYEHDRIPGGAFNWSDKWWNTNRRVKSQRTVYHDDSNQYTETVSSSFDGLGHYRTAVADGNLNGGATRSATTNFNSVRGVYEVDDANQFTANHTFSMLPPSAAWVLATYDLRSVSEGGQSSLVQFCFNANTGFLDRRRVWKNAAAPHANDVLAVYTGTSGNVSKEQHYGGDVQSLSASTNLCGLGLPAQPHSEIRHTYAHGSLESSQYFDANAQALWPYRSVDTTIDEKSGFVAASRDSAGFQTDYEYDLLGRLIWVKPQANPAPGAAWTQYKYDRAGTVAGWPGPRVEIFGRSGSNPSGNLETQRRVYFDPAGRIAKEEQLLGDGVWSDRHIVYYATGEKRSVSERGTAVHKTVFDNYDPFGRPRTITPPDGAAHAITLQYTGARVVQRTVKVGTAYSGGSVTETPSTTTERYDRHGRLYQVVEPSGPGGANVTTTYSYDEGNRLSQASTTSAGVTQNRLFTYDNRGFLISEQHPEKGAGGGGNVTYSAYDPLGRLGRKIDGPDDLLFIYNKAGQLTDLDEDPAGPTGVRALKRFTYGSGTALANLSRGKVEVARRFNYVVVGGTPFTVVIKETYQYGGSGGRVSWRETRLQTGVNGAPPTDSYERFTQTFEYHPLGKISKLGYPQCTFQNCAGTVAARNVDFTYSNGRLWSVPVYSNAIRYHANGMVSQVKHSNGATDVYTDVYGLDPNFMQRPSSITTTGASPNWTQANPYLYDGAGDIKKIGNDYFLYDGVSRLIDGHFVDIYNPDRFQTYTYDAFGNLNVIGGTSGRSTQTSPSTNHLDGGTYDGAGNLTAWNLSTYQYDALNLMWRLDTAPGTGQERWVYLYSADDERVWSYCESDPSKNYWTLRDLEGKVLRQYSTVGDWSLLNEYVYRDGQLLSGFQSGAQRHYTVDHLGTPRLITGSGGAQAERHDYYPFGEEINYQATAQQRMKFTGHERDLANLTSQSDDLDYMHARHYGPLTGRFMSTDPLGARPGLPQSWNRYEYVLDRPLTLIDPTGRWTRCGAAGCYIEVVAPHYVFDAYLFYLESREYFRQLPSRARIYLDALEILVERPSQDATRKEKCKGFSEEFLRRINATNEVIPGLLAPFGSGTITRTRAALAAEQGFPTLWAWGRAGFGPMTNAVGIRLGAAEAGAWMGAGGAVNAVLVDVALEAGLAGGSALGALYETGWGNIGCEE